MKSIFEKNAKYILKATLFCIVFTGLFIVFTYVKGFLPSDFERIGYGAAGIAAAFLTTILFLKYDSKRFSDIGLVLKQSTPLNFFKGVLTGILIMGSLIAGSLYFSNVTIEVNPESSISHFFLATLFLIPFAFMEELGFRAYPLETLKPRVGIRLTIIITAILFALYHIANGWSIGRAFTGPAVWGMVFGLAAIHSKGIAMPTGIHYAANLTSSAFGTASNTVSIWLVKEASTPGTKTHGSYWATIIPALVLFIFAVFCMEWYVRRKVENRQS